MSTLNFILPWWGSTSAIKMDRWQREGRERDRDIETEAEAMTGATKTAAFLVRLSVSWEAKKASQLHASFITEPHYQWHPHWGTRMQNVTTIQLLPRIGFFRRGFCIGRRVSVLFLKQRVDLFLFFLHLEPRYNSCTLRCKHQRSVIKKHEAHTIMLTTKSTPIVCTYGSARLHLKAKFEKKYDVFELNHFTRQMVSIYAIINSWLPAFLFTFTYFCSHLCCMAPNAFIAFDIRLNIRP